MPDKLSRREREILNIIFALGDHASAEDVRTALTAPPSYSAVRAMLAKLENKGYVRHREEHFRYIYSPTTLRATAGRAALHELVKVFFHGSPGETAAALLKNENWSDEELAAVSAEIERIRHERKRVMRGG